MENVRGIIEIKMDKIDDMWHRSISVSWELYRKNFSSYWTSRIIFFNIRVTLLKSKRK